MLAFLGALTVLLVFALIMTRAMTPLIALISVPLATGLVGGFAPKLSGFVVAGIQQTAPVAAMFVFAILYFGVMTDAGLLDPIVDRILRVVGHHPARIVVGTTLLALLVHLDGSGAVTFLVTIPTMLPLYERLQMDKRILACVASLAAGVNFLPWTGPTARASVGLHVTRLELFQPLIPVQTVGLLFVFGVAYVLGKREEKRLGTTGRTGTTGTTGTSGTSGTGPGTGARPISDLRRPRMFWPNLLLTIALMTVMIGGYLDPSLAFMVGTAAALLLNYRRSDEQRLRIDAHAKAAIAMAAILMAAGAFTGIMDGSGMLKALAQSAVHAIPPGMGRHIPVILGLVAMPLSLLFDPDSFYLGALPVVAQVAGAFGVAPVQVGQAALLGQMTTGFPVSPLTPATFLLTGLSGIDLASHQRFTGPLLFAASVIMTIACVVFGIFAL